MQIFPIKIQDFSHFKSTFLLISQKKYSDCNIIIFFL